MVKMLKTLEMLSYNAIDTRIFLKTIQVTWHCDDYNIMNFNIWY